jgi:hypothetical protein
MGVVGDGLEEWSGDTVSTLTLEALAYLPPPLINTARYWSRRTPTAQWKSLGYDAGRYAYTAINVSDYLDINRVRANVMRDSSPSNRISFAYLFENDAHTGSGQNVKPQNFDDFIDKIGKDTKYRSRLVSLADYNLAIHSGSYGDIGFKSPFCEFITNGDGDGPLYGDVSLPTIRRQQFVTDSWYPAPVTNNVLYLTEDQPFDGIKQSLYEMYRNKSGGEVYKRLLNQMDVVSLGALYDYVDEDSIPISLAIPTIERTPMITGITAVPSGFGIKMEYDDEELVAATEKEPRWLRRTWKLKSLGDDPTIILGGCGVFPFKRSSGRSAPPSYDVEVMVKCFFSSTDLDFTKTRLSRLALKPRNRGDWVEDEYALMASDKAYLKLVTKGKVSFQTSCSEDDDCLVNLKLDPIEIDSTKAVGGLGVYGLRYQEGKETVAAYDNGAIDKPLYYYNAAGKIVPMNDAATADVSLKLNFAVWVRIVAASGDDKNKTVDLVPATLGDDAIYNKDGANFVSKPEGTEDDYDFMDNFSGDKEPVLPITTSALVTVNEAVFKDGLVKELPTPGLPESVDLGKLVIYCDDPRFNFAPEDWYAPEGASETVGSKWLETARSRCDGENGRQRDIFQFVSDCGYLQSMGELQFLPFLCSPGKDGFRRYPQSSPNVEFCDYLTGASKYNGRFATSADNTANNKFTWRTHWAFGSTVNNDWYRNAACSPYMWGILDAPDGAVVTPFSASDELLMAGLANTPYDWTIAGLAADGEFGPADIKKYCFNGYSGNNEAELRWTDLAKIASVFRKRFQEGEGWNADLNDGDHGDDWNRCWYDEDTFFGLSAEDLNIHDVDRKFLYSFWKNCFGDRQQLFLVFVRAEPSVLGGGTGRTPAQLGARAVALVWRDPSTSLPAPEGANVPVHRMRILFYHQFD